MARIEKIVFREITAADFYWINQSGNDKGGRQAYFDFNTSDVTPQQWEGFFAGTPASKAVAKGGPYWTFAVKSLGTGQVQTGVKLGQRRDTSYSIRSQKLPQHSKQGQRLYAWRPSNGFPALPPDVTSADQVPAALIAGVRIFLLRDDGGEFWAGWTRQQPPGLTDPLLLPIFQKSSAMINIASAYEIDAQNPQWPFRLKATATTPTAASPATVTAPSPKSAPNTPAAASPLSPVSSSIDGLAEMTIDESNAADASAALTWDEWDPADELEHEELGVSYKMQQVRKRNRAAVAALKKLYGECQITGSAYVFQSAKGAPYLEVHHLVPLGLGGADSPHNMVVLSAHAHRMLHHANVTGLDLAKIKDNSLTFLINGQPATITWHPKHTELVLAQNSF